MQSINEKLRKALLFLPIILPLFIGLFQPLMGDDHFFITAINNQGLVSFFTHFYMSWSGRVLSSIVMYFSSVNHFSFLLMGIMNGCFLVGTIYFLASLAAGRIIRPFQLQDSLIFLITFVLVWFGLPDLGTPVFWHIGSAVYLYPGFFAVTFMFLFMLPGTESYAEGSKKRFRTYIYAPLLFVFGFLAGSSAEQAFVSLVFGSGMAIFFLWRAGNLRVPFHVVGVIGLVAGGLVLFLAPGNYVRLHALNEVNLNVSFVASTINTLGHVVLYSFQYMFNCFAVVLLIILYWKRQDSQLKTRIPMSTVAIVGLVIAFSSMLIFFAIKAVSLRTFYFFVLFASAAIVSTLITVEKQRTANGIRINPSLMVYICIAFSLFLSFDMARGLYSNLQYSADVAERDEYIFSQVQAGNKVVTVDNINVADPRISATGDYLYAPYYGATDIITVGQKQTNISDVVGHIKHYLSKYLSGFPQVQVQR